MASRTLLKRMFLEQKSLLKLARWIPVVAILEIILTVSTAHFFRGGIDIALAGGETYIRFAYALMAVIISLSLTIYLRELIVGLLSERAIAALRSKATQQLAYLPIPTLERMHSGDNLSKLTNDIQLVKRFLDSEGYQLVVTPLMAVASLAYIVYLNWQLSLASIIVIPMMMLATVKLSAPLQSYSKALQEELANISKTNQDILGGIQIVKSFNLMDVVLTGFRRQVDESVRRGRAIAVRRAVVSSVSTFLSFVPFLTPLAIGNYLITRGQMSVGALLAFINLLNNLTWPLSQLPNHYASYKGALAGLSRIYELIDMEPERQTGAIFASDGEQIVRLENIRFSYTDQDVLQGLTFTITKGETVALVGPSGGGKSTIFKLITGFYRPSEGRVELFNHPLEDWKLEAVRKEIAVVSQDTYLFPTTIRENIALGQDDISMEKIIAAAKQANAHDFILGLPGGYDTLVGERGAKLSGGQRQRISIARAILKDAKLLLLDEATSALDTESEHLVQQALEEAMTDRTTMVIAHRLSTIKNADRIMVLAGGTVVETGSHDELLEANGTYSRLYNRNLFQQNTEGGVA